MSIQPEDMDARDARIGRIVNEFLDRRRRGEPAAEADLLREHPDLAEELRDHLAVLGEVVHAASSTGTGVDRTVLLPPGALPGYEILEELHRGGQGVVYRAIQKATRREMAVKVMREGPFAGWRDRARFEREVQVLGALKHPSIVTIHDSGQVAGCFYFVMDYIAGAPLNAWAGDGSRPVEQTLRLFLQICNAVNAAHLKGIIHRDLKPGNIRVDPEGRPQILDFGLAKMAGPGGTDSDPPDMTAVGQFVGSLPWTSPEQAQGRLDQVDTRTDVYALGVILYQMLCGRFPYDVTGPMRDVLNRIVSEEPLRPSAVRPGLHRDIEAILLKCLRKEPDRRYQTAGELAGDLERHLAGEPVTARGDSGLYLLGVMLRRYRAVVAVAAGFAVVISAAMLTSLTLWRQAVAERDRAVVAEREQERQRSRADAKAAEAEQARAAAEQQRQVALERAERLRRIGYISQIALARNAFEQRHISRVRQLLEACPDDLRGWEWHYLNRLARPPTLLDVVADAGCVTALAVLPDGTRIASGGCEGVVRLWDAGTGERLGERHLHADRITALAAGPDGRRLASGGRDKKLALWDLSGQGEPVVVRLEQAVGALCFTPDGARLVAGGQDRRLTFRNPADGSPIDATGPLPAAVSCAACSPDGRYLAAGTLLQPGGQGGAVAVWELTTLRKIHEFADRGGAALSLAFSPDSARLAVGRGMAPAAMNAEGTLQIIEPASGRTLLSLPGHEGFVEALAFSPDGRLLASAGAPRVPAYVIDPDRTLKIWDPVTGLPAAIYSAHERGGRALAWSPDGSRLFSGGMDGRLKAWPPRAAEPVRMLAARAGPVMRLAFSPDGRHLASCSAPREAGRPGENPPGTTIDLWDVDAASLTASLVGHRDAILGLAWSPDGTFVASAGTDRSIRLWDSRNASLRRTFDSGGATVQGVAISPDGRLLAALTGATATLWEMADGIRTHQLPHPENPVALAFSPDGRTLATGTAAGLVSLWVLDTGEVIAALQAGPGLNGLWFSPDGTRLAVARSNGSILLCDPSGSNASVEMAGGPRSVQWLDFSPDGRRIVSCTSDPTVRLWDTIDATEVFSFQAAESGIECVRFSPDGRILATSAQDGVIRLWEAWPEGGPAGG